MRAVYPGKVVLDLIGAVLRGSRCQALAGLLEHAGRIEPARWARLQEGLASLEHDTVAGLRWPGRAVCEQTRGALYDVFSSWQLAVEEVGQRYAGTDNRTRRRDPAYRRATQWWSLLSDLLVRMAVERPDLRMTMDYSLAILDAFEDRDQGGRGIEELLTLDVLSLLEYGLTGAPSLFPVLLEVGGVDRRKRLQRERLKVLLHWQTQSSGSEWADELLPRISGLSRRLVRSTIN